MSRYESIRLVTLHDPDYLRWREWNNAAARDRRAAARASRTPSLPVPQTPQREALAPLPVPRLTPATSPAVSDRAPAPAEATGPLHSAEPAAPSLPGDIVTEVSASTPHHSVARATFARDAEYLLRRELRRHLPVWDRRILRYSFQKPDGRWTIRYRELDVVALDGRRLYIFEIKATRRVDAVEHGIAQLSFVRDVLAGSFLDVVTTLLVVDTDRDSSGGETPVTKHLLTSPDLVAVSHLRELTTAPVIHAIPLTLDDVEALTHRPLDLSWRTAA